jgi:hypothetical protein
MLGPVIAVLFVAVPPTAARAQNVVSVPPSGDLRVTVYEGQGALFSDHRRAALAVGVNELRLEGVPASATAGSFDVQVLNGPAVRLLERVDTPREDRPASALSALIGQSIAVVRRGADGQTAERLEGTLLRVSDSGAIAALQVGGRVVLDPRGEIEVSPEQLAALSRPAAAVLRVESPAAGEADLLISYLVPKAEWSAEHTVSLRADGGAMSLASWACVSVPGAVGLSVSGLRLVAGTSALPTGPYVCDLPRATTFGPEGQVRICLAGATGVPVTNLLLFDGGQLDTLAKGDAAKGPVQRVTRFENAEPGGLGLALPGGEVYVYQVSETGTSKLISRSTVPDSLPTQTVDLVLGEAGGLRGTSRQESWRELSPEDIERKCEMTIANATKAAQTVTCGVTMSGKWRIAESSHPYVARPGNRVEFTVPIKADEASVTLAYTVRIEVPSNRAKPAGDESAPAPAPQ